MQLTPDQIAQYQEAGYVRLGRILDDAALEELRTEEARFRQPIWFDENGEPIPEPRVITRFQLHHYSEPIRRVFTAGPHINVLQQLIGPNVCAWHNQFLTKLPDEGSGTSAFLWHQDNGYVHLKPPTNVTVWCALDDVDERNGCVWVMPGSHQKGLVPHNIVGESLQREAEVEGEGIPVLLKAGEAVAFSGFTLHHSKANHTQKVRRAFFMEYCDANATYRHLVRGDSDYSPIAQSPDAYIVAGGAKWPPSSAT